MSMRAWTLGSKKSLVRVTAPLFVAAAGTALVGQAPTEAAFTQAAALAQQAARPISDVRGTAAQRHHLVGVLVKRALRNAVCRAQGGNDE